MFSFSKNKRIGFLALLLLVTTHAYGQSACEINFVMVGDSITQGLQRDQFGNFSGIETPQNGADIDEGSYGPSLKDKTRALGCDSVRAFNWGVGGSTTAEAISRSDQIIATLSQQASEGALNIALIMLGANDAFDLNPSIIGALDQIQSKFSAAGIMPVLATVTQNTRVPQFPEVAALVIDYGNQVRFLGQQENLIVVDQFAAVQPFSQLNSGDGLHISSLGYEVMATAWFEGVESVLTEYIESLRTGGFLPAVYLLLLDED